jgi:hypothetical protein
MQQTRDLLLDCRVALRRTDPRFDDSPLKRQLDSVIVEMGQAEDARRIREEARPEQPLAAARVAYTWQSVARELRHSHPEVYQRLWEQVLKRLEAKAIDDPAQEIDALQHSLESAQLALSAAEREIGELRAALANGAATPERAPAGDDPQATTALGPAVFQAVAAGEREFTPQELEWCLTEAMVRTGFLRTPVQLLEQGEAGLARLMLETVPAAA